MPFTFDTRSALRDELRNPVDLVLAQEGQQVRAWYAKADQEAKAPVGKCGPFMTVQLSYFDTVLGRHRQAKDEF